MKRNGRQGPGADYARLKIKVMLQMLGMVVGGYLLVIVLYTLVWAGRGADFMVWLFQNIFRIGYEDAFNIYHTYIRGNSTAIVLAGVGIAFCAYLYFFITRFTRYFNEVNAGIDQLVLEQGEIRLSPELEAIERKLNTVRQNLKDREAAAKEAEQRKNNLVMYLAHDIRTPLTSVIGYLSLLDEAPHMPTEQRAKYVHITLEKAIRLEYLVNEFFAITRYNSQHIVLQKETIDLHYMLVQLLDEFYPILAARGQLAALQADEDLTVYGDAVHLARVFNNLLKNAAAYSDPDTEIRVAAKKAGGWVAVSFQNFGPTIPPEKLGAVFEQFYRLDASRASDSGGAGLGLSIAQDIAKAHGGAITAASENGVTTFTVSLPAGAPQTFTQS